VKLIFENWKRYLKEAEDSEEGEKSNVLDLSSELHSGFCEFNPLINQYAQASPENMAEMLIFVIATQRQRWYEVVEKFPILMAFIKERDTLLDPRGAFVNSKGKTMYSLPKDISILTLGFRKNAIQSIWEDRNSFYQEIMAFINVFNNAGNDTIAKEEAQFDIYLRLLRVPGLALPKAAFASQLIIGRLGCIDSINMNLYKGLDPKGELITVDKRTGAPQFKKLGKKKTGKIISLTPGGVKLAKKYIEFLQHIAEMTGAKDISRQLWNSWVEIVAKKINVGGDLQVILPGGEKFSVPNDYSRKRSQSFTQKYGKPTGHEISKQHDPRELSESQKIWNNYFYSVLRG